MARVSVTVRRTGGISQDVGGAFTRLTVTDAIGLRGDGADLELVGDWSDAAAVGYTIVENDTPTRNISANLTALSASVRQGADGETVTRLKAGRRVGSNGAYYVDQIRALITTANIRALGARHAGWDNRFVNAAGVDVRLADVILQALDESEGNLNEYISTLADYRIGVLLDAVLPAASAVSGVSIYDMDRPTNADEIEVSPLTAIEWRREFNRYPNPLSAYSTAPYTYLVGTRGAITLGSGDIEPEDLGEFQYSPQAFARRDAYRSRLNGESLTGTLVVPTFDSRIRPRTGLTVSGATPGGLLRWLVESVILDADADGGFKATYRLRATQGTVSE